MSNSKRLVKNTFFMYIRMTLLMVISFYTSRVVLEQLGVEDFGIYNLVGSIVAMFNSLRTIFASSTQRFLNYEMGTGNNEKLYIVFNMSLFINIAIAIIFVIFVECVGFWFFNTSINISPDRINAAYFVFQFSIITAVISIITTIFDAILISHEHMGFYSFLYILESFFKLGIVFLLKVSPYDKLISYGFLYLLISILTLIFNFLYCKVNFSEVRFRKCWDNEYFKKMTSFAGWNFFGNTSNALTQSGVNMLLNTFGGPIVNAARGVAFQLNSAMLMFISNIGIVISPFSIKLYAKKEYEKFYEMIFISSKLFFTLQLCLIIPFIFYTNELLSIWLTEVPEYAVIFLRLILIHSLVRSIHPSIDTVFKATGNIKHYQLIEGLLLIFPLILGYFALRNNYPYYFVFIITIFVELINTISILFLLKKRLNFKLLKYISNVIIPCITLLLIPIGYYFILKYANIDTLLVKLISCICLDIIICIVMYLFVLNLNERKYLLSILKK